MNEVRYTCAHCGESLNRWEPSSESGWDHDLYMCDNDECPYFVGGQKKIAAECKVNFAYRYGYDPLKDRGIPIACWCGGHLSLLKGKCARE